MSKLKFLIGTLVVSGFAVAMTASAACDLGVSTLKVGSKGVSVSAMQSILGVNPDGNFGPMTKAAVVAWQANHGLVADGVVGAMTRSAMAATCGATVVTTPTTTTTVSGTAGDATISDNVSKNVKDAVKEGDEEKVLGLKVEAEDSDISLTNIKISLANAYSTTNDKAASEKLTNYIDEVKVYLGDEEVGSVDASDFSKASGTPDEFTKSISLSNAVVKEGEYEYLYLAVVASDSIDSDDQLAKWVIGTEVVRYTDGTGAIMSADDNSIDNTETFAFDDESSEDLLSVKSSSANPAKSTIAVDADDETEDVLIGAFKLEVDEDSSDITVNSLPIEVTVSAGNVDDVITDLYVTIDGEEYSADIDEDYTSGTSAIYYVELEDEDVVIEADDSVEVKVYASFDSTDDGDNYDNDITVQAELDSNDIDAEGSDDLGVDELAGTFTGKVHTLSTVDITVTRSTYSTSLVDSDDNTVVEYKLELSVKNAGDDDLYIPYTAFESYVIESTTGTYSSGTKSVSIEAKDSDIENTEDNYFKIDSDSTEVLILTVTLDNGAGTQGSYRLAVDEMNYSTDSDLSDEQTFSFTAVKTGLKYAGANN